MTGADAAGTTTLTGADAAGVTALSCAAMPQLHLPHPRRAAWRTRPSCSTSISGLGPGRFCATFTPFVSTRVHVAFAGGFLLARLAFFFVFVGAARFFLPNFFGSACLAINSTATESTVEVWDFQHSHSLVLFHGHLV
jgi:hypothetical protein